MTREFKKNIIHYVVGLAWFYLLLFPLMGIKPDGFVFGPSLKVLGIVAIFVAIFMILKVLKNNGVLDFILEPMGKSVEASVTAYDTVPGWIILLAFFAASASIIFFGDRYIIGVAISVMVYVCLGLGLNVVVGLCGLLDLGFIAFYGVGAYVYALLATQFGISFWLCLPLSMGTAMIVGCIIGYPTLRMRGDYLAIVTLGFGEIVRLVLNNWNNLTGGPNGVLRIPRPVIWIPDWAQGLSLTEYSMRSPTALYCIILAFTMFTIVAMQRLNYSRVGRAWEAMREDETAAELMGVNTYMYKLLAYAMGAMFGGMAGAYFAAWQGSIFPTSFSFIESAMVLAMVVLGGMGSLPGVILGAIVLIALPEAFREIQEYRMLAFGAAMTTMMVLRPAGLIPAKRFAGRSEEK